MTYQRHWLLSWGGTVGDGSDIFANNVRMMNDESLDPDSLDDGAMEDLLDDFVTDIRALFGTVDSFIPDTVRCQWVKFNEIGPDGRYVDKTKTHARFLTGSDEIRGAKTGVIVPTFQSTCVTTTTARERGPASKGRLYVPQCGLTLTRTGRHDPTAAQTMAGAWAAFFTDLGDEEGIDTHAIAPAVVSNVGTPGPVERITGVRVGDVPDVIRRRKNAMDEVYRNATVSTA